MFFFMLYTPSYGNSQLKMEILEFTSKEAAAPLMSLAAPYGGPLGPQEVIT